MPFARSIGDYYAAGMLLQFAIDDATGDRDARRHNCSTSAVHSGRAQYLMFVRIVVGEGYKALGEFDAGDRLVESRAADLHVPWTLVVDGQCATAIIPSSARIRGSSRC